ncbi:HEPN domain-containing protein [Pseudorhodoferax sp.]|uniref:HEPN domain-containing protein n=1 Tax=Pseudorhodoferax sp. TaxID=1993553 RepID=UPI0039E5E1FC
MPSEQIGLISHDSLGRTCGIVILSSLSIEVALKSLLEKHGKKPPKTHDHIQLYDLVPADTQEMLQDRFEVTAITQNPIGPTNIRSILESTRQSFEHWRYIHESPRLSKIDLLSVFIAAKVIAAESGSV